MVYTDLNIILLLTLLSISKSAKNCCGLTRGVARFIKLGEGQLTALIEYLTVILEYINVFQFLLAWHSQILVGPETYQAHPWLCH